MKELTPRKLYEAIKGAGGGGGGGSQHTPTESPDSLHSTSLARIVDLIAEGELQGFKHGQAAALMDIYFNETPVMNADGSLNFKNVSIDTRSGIQDQSFMPGFPDVENEIAINTELRSTANWTQSITNTATTSVRVTLSVPQLLQSNTSNGDITGYTIAYAIDIAADGGSYTTIVNSSISGKTTTKYQRSHTFALPHAVTSWTLRIRRLTANQNLATIQDTMMIDSYTQIEDVRMRYSNSAVVGTILDSTQFTSIPSRSFDMYGRIIQVPTNYDPVARTYSGVWDGTFKSAWTNNPAWVYYDAITNDRFGLGNRINTTLVNKWTLYTIAQYCDELVPNLAGGTEPRFTAFIYQQSQTDAQTFLNNLTSIFRGISYWAGGAIQCSSDMPGSPEYIYSPANVVGGYFKYEGSQRKTRYTVALVTWNDPNDFGRQKVCYVPDREGIARYGIRPVSVTSSGATSLGQAMRTGLWMLYTSRLETETCTFKVGLDGTLCPPGAIVQIVDPYRAGKRMGGRIHGATATVVTVDKAPDLCNVGDSLTCVLPSGVSETHTITALAAVDGNGRQAITIGAPGFSAVPATESMWLVAESTLQPQEFRIISVKEPGPNDPLEYEITAVEHNASKFAAVDLGVPVTTAPTIYNQGATTLGPDVVTVSSHVITGTNLVQAVLDIAWDAVAGAVGYNVQYRRSSGSWVSLDVVQATQVSITGVAAGTYDVQVRAITGSGARSAPTAAPSYTVADPTQAPTSYTALSAAAANAQSAANAAQASANAANAELTNIASDNNLSSAEKPTVIRDQAVIAAEQSGIDAQAVNYLGASSSQQVAYDNAITALNSYLATLTSPTAWNNKAGDTTIVGTTFRTNFNNVYLARQTLLNAIYGKAQALANTAQTSATAAQVTANQLNLLNLSFGQGITGWNPSSDAANWYGETGSNGPGGVGTYAVHKNSGTLTQLNNTRLVPVYGGLVIKATGQIKGVGGSNGGASLYAAFYDGNGTLLSTPNSNIVSGDGFHQVVLNTVAPTNAAFAAIGPSVSNTATVGYYSFGSFWWSYQPATVDEVPDGASYLRSTSHQFTSSSWTINNALFQMPLDAQGNVPGWAPVGPAGTLVYLNGASPAPNKGSQYLAIRTVAGSTGIATSVQKFAVRGGDNITIGGTIYAVSGVYTALIVNYYDTNNNPTGTSLQFGTTSAAWTGGNTSGVIPTTAVYATISCYVGSTSGVNYGAFNWVYVSVNDVRIQGSGSQIGDQRNLPAVTFSNYGSGWSGLNLTYSSTTTTATINASAATLQAGSVAIAYNASSVPVTGSAGTTVTYYLYYSDASHAGGAQTLHATTSVVTAISNDSFVYVGTASVVYPSSGTGGGSGGGPCPVREAWVIVRDRDGLPQFKQAGDVEVGDWLLLCDGTWGEVTHSKAEQTACVKVHANAGTFSGSVNAPLRTRQGDWLAPNCDDADALVRLPEGESYSYVYEIEQLGQRWVQHITCQNTFFWTGDAQNCLFAHHNMKMQT